MYLGSRFNREKSIISTEMQTFLGCVVFFYVQIMIPQKCPLRYQDKKRSQDSGEIEKPLPFRTLAITPVQSPPSRSAVEGSWVLRAQAPLWASPQLRVSAPAPHHF